MIRPDRFMAVLGSALLLSACGDVVLENGSVHDVKDVPGGSISFENDLAKRYPDIYGTQSRQQTSEPEISAADLYSWEKPAAWQVETSTRLRDPNFSAAGQVQCYLTTLGPRAGTLLENVNRWRGQLAAGQWTEDDLAAAPRVSCFGKEAVLVDITGDFSGMGGVSIKDARLLGVVLHLPVATITVKMVGPQAAVAEQEAAFKAFVASLQFNTAAGVKPAGERASAKPATPPVDDSGPLTWQLPSAWNLVAGNRMRVMTAQVDGCICYIFPLGGSGGGELGNLNRWAGEIGGATMDDAAVAALPKLSVLGAERALLVLHGNFKGTGAEAQQNASLFGISAIGEPTSYFIKMVGPKEQMAAQLENFKAFCQSLQVKGAE